MKKTGMGFDDAVLSVKKARSIINMNDGFIRQLRAWERDVSKNQEGVTLSPTSPKTPIVEIGPLNVIDWREAEAEE